MTPRLYAVSRADLPPGVQAVQAAHSLLSFAIIHPDLVRVWGEDSQNLILLSAPDEAALCWLCACAERDGHLYSAFREPDLGGQLTAVTFEPAAARMLSGYPLLLREKVSA